MGLRPKNAHFSFPWLWCLHQKFLLILGPTEHLMKLKTVLWDRCWHLFLFVLQFLNGCQPSITFSIMQPLQAWTKLSTAWLQTDEINWLPHQVLKGKIFSQGSYRYAFAFVNTSNKYVPVSAHTGMNSWRLDFIWARVCLRWAVIFSYLFINTSAQFI